MRRKGVAFYVKESLVWAAFLLIAIFVLFPILWGLRTSLTPRFDNGFIPAKLTLEHYSAIFSRPEVWRYFGNSLIISFGTILIVLPVSLLAAYAIARFKFKGSQFSIVFLILPLLPAIALLVPLIAYMNFLHLYNTFIAVVLVNVVFSMPFAIWMLKNFILANPIGIEEAALIDGCSRIRMLVQIAVPMMTPGIVSVAVYIFIGAWNNYMYSFALSTSPLRRVLPQAILGFLGAWGANWGGLNAIGILAMIPPVFFFLLFQKWFVAGLFGQQLK